MQDKEMLEELIVESREHIQGIEPDLLELETKGANVSEELINRVFRAMHSIKGGFGFFGIERVVRLSHAMENAMAGIRDHLMAITPELTDALLIGVDKLRTLLDDINNVDAISIDEELAKLKPYIAAAGGDKSQSTVKAASEDIDALPEIRSRHPKFTDEHIFEAIRNGKLIYEVAVIPKTDLQENNQDISVFFEAWEKFGQIVDAVPPISLMKQDSSSVPDAISIVYSTVLEADLISQAIGVNSDRILAIDMEPFRKKHRENRAASSKDSDAPEGREGGMGKADVGVEESLRVKVGLLNNLMNFAGELVLSRNQFLQILNRKCGENVQLDRIIKAQMDIVRKAAAIAASGANQQQLDTEYDQMERRFRQMWDFSISSINGMGAIAQNIDMVTTVLQENIMQTRMQPVSVVFSKFPRVIRDLAKKLGKEIGLTLIGQDVELDKSIVELLSDPLTHLIRNAAGHGIEDPQTRISAGKEPRGEIVLRAYQEGGKVIIEVQDDGAGINPDKVRRKAVEKGIITQEKADSLSVSEVQQLIFVAGFSTMEQVNDVSGRGVGMDVVKNNVERLGGTIELLSTPGSGSSIVLKLPLTLAIIPSLIVETGGRRFAIPQMGLEEVVRIRAKDVTKKIERIQGAEVLRLRDKLLPLVRLAGALGMPSTFVAPDTDERHVDRRERLSDRRGRPETEDSPAETTDERRTGNLDRRISLVNAVKVVVLRTERNLYGLIVDDVLDTEEIVVKQLPEYLKAISCYAGVTIMGDGKVAMILDPVGIAGLAGLAFADIEKEMNAEKEKAKLTEAKNIRDLVLFTIGGTERFAIDLSAIARIEKRENSEIELIGDSEFVNYEKSSMRLVRLERYLPITQPAMPGESTFIIVPKNTQKPIGIVAASVEDTVQTEVVLDTRNVTAEGIAGTSIINKKMTIILDAQALLAQFA